MASHRIAWHDIAPKPTPDRNRHKQTLAGRLEHAEHRRVPQRRVAEARDVEKRDLVRALLVVARGELDGFAQVADLAACTSIRPLPHVVLVALGHDEVSRIVAADVEARHDALGHTFGHGGSGSSSRNSSGGGGGGGGSSKIPTSTNMSPEKGSQKVQPSLAALLGVKLRRHHVALADGRDKVDAIARGRVDPFLGARTDAKRVDKVESRRVERGSVHASLRRRRALSPRRREVPPNVRNRERAPSLLDHHPARKPRDLSLDDAQTSDARRLVAALKQGLHAEANAKERAVRRAVLLQRRSQPSLVQHRHRGAKGADARKYEALDLVRQQLLGCGNVHDTVTQLANGVANAPDVARAIVEEVDRRRC